MKKSIFIFFISATLFSQQPHQITGQTFFEYSYTNDHYSSQLKNVNSFDIKRILVFYDRNYENNLNFRFGLEGNNSDISPAGTYNIFLKALFFEKKILENKYSVQMGLFPTATNAFDEKIWGNRFLEKVILDKNSFGAPTDIGIAFKGSLVQDLSFNFAVVNGNAIKPENDKNKKILTSFIYKFNDEISTEIYNDFENVGSGKNKSTNKISLGYATKSISFGLTGFQKNFKNLGTVSKDNLVQGFSSFASYTISEDLKAIGRFDFFDKNINDDNEINTDTYMLFGLNYLLDPKVYIAPNIIIKENKIDKNSAVTSNKETYFRLNIGMYF